MKEIARRLVGNVWRTGVVEENGNGGSQPGIGTSMLIAVGAGQAGLPVGFGRTSISYTVDSLVGSDLAIDGDDDTQINVLTDGWYQITAHVGISGGSGFTTMQLQVDAGSSVFDDYPAADGANFGGCDLTITTPIIHLTGGDVIRVSVGTDGSGNYTIESNPNQLHVVRVGGPLIGGSQPVQVAVVAISSAELLALHSSPKTLVAAPGVGYMLIPMSPVVAIYTAGTPYTGSNQLSVTTPQLQINEGAGAIWCEAPILGLLDGFNSVSIATVPANSTLEEGDSPDSFNNQPLIAYTPTANLADGTGTATLVIPYMTVPTPLS